MKIKELIALVTEAAKGSDNFESGAVGSNGYGFIFKDFNSNIPYITSNWMGKVCSVGAYRDVVKNFNKYEVKSMKELHSLSRYDWKYDLYLAGAVKTLVPTLQFGGDELLFEVWMFIKTPDDKTFPAAFYRGQSGFSIGGWSLNPKREKALSRDLEKIINFSPFDFTENERECFLDAFEFALRKISSSDYWGIYTDDLGDSLMGLRNGKPFIKKLRNFERDPKAEEELEPLLGKNLQDTAGNIFMITTLPGTYVYIIDFEDQFGGSFISDAKHILDLYKSLLG